jgi:hypothetical protein
MRSQSDKSGRESEGSSLATERAHELAGSLAKIREQLSHFH